MQPPGASGARPGPYDGYLVSEIIVVANRGPSVSFGPDGAPVAAPSAGGVAPSLQRALQLAGGGRWICAAQRPDEHTLAGRDEPVEIDGVAVSFVSVPETTVRGAVGVIANQTLWFVNHNLYDPPHRPVFDRHWHEAWDRYREYNGAFADKIVALAPRGATVVVNDYHLALVGAGLARLRPDLSTVLFFHTPFAAPEELRILPRAERSELLGAMCAFGAMGFHVDRWADAFVRSAALEGFATTVFVAPLGVDPEALAVRAGLARDRDPQIRARRASRWSSARRAQRPGGAFEEHPARLSRLRRDARARAASPRSGQFGARVYASRTDLAEYLAYANDLQRTVDRINERFGALWLRPDRARRRRRSRQGRSRC